MKKKKGKEGHKVWKCEELTMKWRRIIVHRVQICVFSL